MCNVYTCSYEQIYIHIHIILICIYASSVCLNTAYNPESSRMYSLYTINACSVYCIRSVYMSCRDLRPENRTQVVFSQTNGTFYPTKVELLRGSEDAYDICMYICVNEYVYTLHMLFMRSVYTH